MLGKPKNTPNNTLNYKTTSSSFIGKPFCKKTNRQILILNCFDQSLLRSLLSRAVRVTETGEVQRIPYPYEVSLIDSLSSAKLRFAFFYFQALKDLKHRKHTLKIKPSGVGSGITNYFEVVHVPRCKVRYHNLLDLKIMLNGT